MSNRVASKIYLVQQGSPTTAPQEVFPNSEAPALFARAPGVTPGCIGMREGLAQSGVSGHSQ